VEHKRLDFRFHTIEDLERALKGHEKQIGFFLDPSWDFQVGERVTICATVSGAATPVFFEGTVVWRRSKGTEKMKPGIFIELLPRDQARLDGVFAFLREARNREKRRWRRIPVRFSAVYKTSKGDFNSEVTNISEGGVFLRCQGPLLTVGAQFPLVLYPPSEKEGVPLKGRVAWIDFFEETQGMGVAFLDGQAQLRRVKKIVSECEKQLRPVRPAF
jgi:Tfp pilus assembly protein PilZ